MKRLICIDGNSIVFRAYYGTAAMGNLMTNSNGLCTNAIYGFVNMIQHVYNTIKFDNIIVAFDKGKKTLRHQSYSEYKGTRSKTPEELIMQLPYVRKYLDCAGIKWLELDDYEADDIVGSYATQNSCDFDEVMVISGDKDLLQLAHDNITVCLTKRGTTELVKYTESNMFEMMGFNSNQLVDYKGLFGDDSDNLPGIAGVGDKTAKKLLESYGTLENILDHVDDIPGKIGMNLKEGKEVALMCKKLATLYTDVSIPFTLEDTKRIKPDYDTLRHFFESLDFKSFIAKMKKEDFDSSESIASENTIKPVEQIINHNVKIYINDISKALELLDKKLVSMEIEFDGDNYHRCNLLGISIVYNDEGVFLDNLSLLNPSIEKALNSDDLHVLAIDIKKLYVGLKYLGITIKHFDFDLILGTYVLDPSKASSDIKSIYDEYIENEVVYLEDVYTKKTKYVIPSIEVYAEYAIRKSYYLNIVKKVIDDKLRSLDQNYLLYNIEIPLATVLGDMEFNGFKINQERLKEVGNEFKNKMDQLEKDIYTLCGCEFNLSSPKQLGEVLFDKLGLAPSKKNKTGLSTAAEVLEKLALEHPVPKLVLEYRKYAKLYNTYVIGLLDVVGVSDSKLHTIFKQYLTLTGRLSSIEPNIQNIPIRYEDGKVIRSAFIPSFENGLLVSADYSQIELRVLAHLSDCKNMLEMFNTGVDLHTMTASKVFGVDPKNVTKDERRMAKAVNFGIVYGMSSWGLAEEIKVSAADAKEFIEKYFMLFPEIKSFLSDVVENAKTSGYTKTIFNRLRYIPELSSTNNALRQFGERTAKNAPIQGSAADIIKLAMINVDKALKENNLKSKLIAQVHDELVIDTFPSEKEIVSNILKETMESVLNLKVQLCAELSSGTNWDMK